MKLKITLVLPPDERIQTVNGRIVFRYPNGNGGHVSVDSDAPHFALICIGLWVLICGNHSVAIRLGIADWHQRRAS